MAAKKKEETKIKKSAVGTEGAQPKEKGGKAARATKEKRENISSDLKITVVKGVESPFREGTKGAAALSLAKTGMTVGEWREAVKEAEGDAGYLHALVNRGLVTLK